MDAPAKRAVCEIVRLVKMFLCFDKGLRIGGGAADGGTGSARQKRLPFRGLALGMHKVKWGTYSSACGQLARLLGLAFAKTAAVVIISS